jgi:hypothetical protein
MCRQRPGVRVWCHRSNDNCRQNRRQAVPGKLQTSGDTCKPPSQCAAKRIIRIHKPFLDPMGLTFPDTS